MKLSARNNIKGKIRSIDIGAVNAEVSVEISPGIEMTSIITKRSCENLRLKEGKEVYLVVKASNVMIGTE